MTCAHAQNTGSFAEKKQGDIVLDGPVKEKSVKEINKDMFMAERMGVLHCLNSFYFFFFFPWMATKYCLLRAQLYLIL